MTVADRFNVSVEDLRQWNHLSAGAMRSGQTLTVSEPVRMAPSAHLRGRGLRSRSGAKQRRAHGAAIRVKSTSRTRASKQSESRSASKAGSPMKRKAAR